MFFSGTPSKIITGTWSSARKTKQLLKKIYSNVNQNVAFVMVMWLFETNVFLKSIES